MNGSGFHAKCLVECVTDLIMGWLDQSGGDAWGCPVDIIFAGNKMYIPDDFSGSIYRVEKAGA